MNLRLVPLLVALLILVAWLPPFAQMSLPEKKCLEDTSRTERTLSVGDGASPIFVETSDRISHQLISEIFKILVVEMLGFSDVVTVLKNGDINNPSESLRRLSPCNNQSKSCDHPNDPPTSMINLEVWLGPGFDLERWTKDIHNEVEDCGPLGPIGRAGWYVTRNISQHLLHEKHFIVDHWRAFRNPGVVSLFDLTRDMKLFNHTINKDGHPYCNETDCVKGIYRPPQCLNRTGCATLLADYPEYNFAFLRKDILRYNLLVTVAWVGPNLESYVLSLSRTGTPTVFFNWKPNTLTIKEEFISVAFPHCEDTEFVQFYGPYDKDLLMSCEFEINQMQKVAWSTIRARAPDIYNLLIHFNISHTAYVELLKNYEAEKLKPDMHHGPIWETACKWLYNNEVTWHGWLPKRKYNQPPLLIGGIFPLSGEMWTQSGIVVAASMAVDDINNNSTILPNYTLVLEKEDGQCEPDVVMKKYIDYVTNKKEHPGKLAGILGPACSETVEPIAGVAKHFNTIIISYSAEGSMFNNREKYPYFYRTVPENSIFQEVYQDLFKRLEYNRVAALTEDSQKYPEYIGALRESMEKQGKHFKDEKFSREQMDKIKVHLTNLKNDNARIIIGDFYDDAARHVMCEAYHLNMTAQNEYVWFLPLWFTSDWFDTDRHNRHKGQQINCTTAQMLEVINGHFSLAYKFYGDKDAILQTYPDFTVDRWMCTYQTHTKLQGKDFSKYGGYAYDAVWVYALALDALLRKNPSNYFKLQEDDVAKEYMALLNKTNFSGVSGQVYFEGSSKPSQVIIWQRVNNRTQKIGTYFPQSSSAARLEMNENSIIWFTPGGIKPSDGTPHSSGSDQQPCLLEGLRRALGGSCDQAIVVLNLVVFSVILLLVIVLFMAFKKKYEAKFRRTEARFRELGLLTSNGVLALDEWEMPRDHIVINRKLGEGAFGTVYGGEAFIEVKGWQAVAVKTLKIGANVEEKLDFLSEAEMMKRFDHTNIVRLIGVCTKGEPVYMVMEFMLYGDLKTYLLARRQLVKESNRHTSEEVSDRQLTRMALDIARGLSYLAELKYVHRDLACRNCLVNSNRTVKIADFGMCRLMYDRDYYRFNKRGMLPVRWMSPESLIDGFFTPMSDVWSYGVLLYEMITFGSFPYQGLSNNQVLEFVKNFNTLRVPKGCKPELECLLLRCWSRDIAQRPAACEIVEILAHHPELISPCLDMPLASVEVADTDSIELNIHERSRVQSVSSSHGHVAPSVSFAQQRRNRLPLERHPSLNGCADLSNGGLVHSESSPLALHTQLLPAKGQYVTLHCRGNQEHSGFTSPKDSVDIASL